VLDLFAFVSIVLYYAHACCIIVSWGGEPGEIESYLDDLSPSFSASTLLVGSSDLLKYLLRNDLQGGPKK